jgi:hypothetical protein
VFPDARCSAWLGTYLEGDDGDNDLARAMLQAFAETLMSAEASATCGAAYNERTEERTNSRNGYRRRAIGVGNSLAGKARRPGGHGEGLRRSRGDVAGA